jgi:RNA polymerase primary sigma factor
MTGIPVDKIERLERALIFDQPASIDDSDDDGFGSSRRAALIDENTPTAEESLERRLIARAIDDAIADLPEMERDILRRRFALDSDESATLREIGEQYSLSRERIRQLQERAIGRIRSELQARELA